MTTNKKHQLIMDVMNSLTDEELIEISKEVKSMQLGGPTFEEERTKELEFFIANLRKEKEYQKEKIEIIQQSLKNCHDVIDKRNGEIEKAKTWRNVAILVAVVSIIAELIW